MRYSSTIVALAGVVLAQRPSDVSICDYYTSALLKENNATNQMTLVTLVVNTAVIGNYTKPNVGIMVPGILGRGMFNGVEVDLLKYFDGALLSTNDGSSAGVSMNFLDDGGAAPLMLNKPANGTTSAQYKLLTHLYEYFGDLLGCSMVGETGYPAYSGETSMYKVHKFMGLDANEIGYFITQVGLSAASFGVATEDVTAVGEALNMAFGYKCAPAVAILPNATAELQAICIADDCPTAANATCAAYDTVVEPANATASASASGAKTSTSGSAVAVSTSSTGSLAFADRRIGGAFGVVILSAIAFAVLL